MSDTLSLGERITLVTRLLVEEHLLQQTREQMPRRDVDGNADPLVGGADRITVTEDCAARFAEGEVA